MRSVEEIVRELRSCGKYAQVSCEIFRDIIADWKKMFKLEGICIGVLLIVNVILLFNIVN